MLIQVQPRMRTNGILTPENLICFLITELLCPLFLGQVLRCFEKAQDLVFSLFEGTLALYEGYTVFSAACHTGDGYTYASLAFLKKEML